MNRVPPPWKSLATRLLAHEATAGRTALQGPAATRVCERWRELLTTLLGAEGFRALLARTLTLAQVDAPALRTTTVAADGRLVDLTVAARGPAGPPFARAEVVLVGHLLGLLVTFIGESLDGVLAEITRIVQATNPSMVVVDSFRTVVRKALGTASETGVQAFSRTLGLHGAKPRTANPRRLSTGIATLDAMLGGGILEGDSVLVSGPSGPGRSTRP